MSSSLCNSDPSNDTDSVLSSMPDVHKCDSIGLHHESHRMMQVRTEWGINAAWDEHIALSKKKHWTALAKRNLAFDVGFAFLSSSLGNSDGSVPVRSIRP